MPTTPQAIANYFIEKADPEGINHLKCQKLVIIAHGWHLALADEPLINDCVEAWQYGPTIQSLYRIYKQYINSKLPICKTYDFNSGGHIPYTIGIGDFKDLKLTLGVLDKVWDVYKNWTDLQLSAITHEEGTPWNEVTKNGSHHGFVISDYTIYKYYKKLKENGY